MSVLAQQVPFRQSLKTFIISILLIQIFLFVSIVGFTLYELDLRRHDYTVLTLASQLRNISQRLIRQSYNYDLNAPRDYDAYERDLGLYNIDLNENIKKYQRIISAFQGHRLPADLTGMEVAIKCTWDEPSINQINKTSKTWLLFKQNLLNSLGTNKNEPRLEAAAEYILKDGQNLLDSSDHLVAEFSTMMEKKLTNISLYNYIAIGLFLLINLILLLAVFKKIFRPLDRTVAGFEYVAKGNLTHQIPVNNNSEISQLIRSFNGLTQRISALFKLTDKIQQATNLDDTLKFIHQEFNQFLPINGVCLLRVLPSSKTFKLERIYSDATTYISEDEAFDLNCKLLNDVISINKGVSVNSINEENCIYKDVELVKRLAENNFNSLILFPLELSSQDKIMLLMTSTEENAYQAEHLELLNNIASQLAHALDKTIGMEGLVISTVEGLAKLAESRDPETGDHLTRMALYSAIIAEELSHHEDFSEQIDPAYIRHVFQFAPMHDIGKVGIADSILLKPGKLSDEERQEMQHHPTIGADVLSRCEHQMNALGYSIFTTAIEIAGCHHEKFDGSGYPNGLSQQDIPLSARIVAAADVFDALTSRRPYKEAWTIEKALDLMNEEAGKHFDPQIITAMQQAMPAILRVYEQHKHV